MNNITFFLHSIFLGAGLAMDAFSVSLANGLKEPSMGRLRMCTMAGVFAAFQALMPTIGWICVHTVMRYFTIFEKFIPYIALALLAFIGGKMLVEGIRHGKEDDASAQTTGSALLMQGIATSIDALSIGFTIAHYDWLKAILSALIIAVVTFIICIAGLVLGKRFGTKLSGKAEILGGVILIAIGIEIFLSGLLGCQ